MTTPSYVAGFAFDYENENVALILKARPDWQKGKFNAIGGHIEGGESPTAAITREWMEETHAVPVEWTMFAVLEGPTIDVEVDPRYGYPSFRVFFFRGNTDIKGLKCFSKDETIHNFHIRALPSDVIPNLHWLIPMALPNQSESWALFIRERL